MSTAAYQLRPWTSVVKPHPDVASGDLAMGTYAANLAAVAYRTETAPGVYDDPAEFFRSTYLTPAMRKVLADTFGVLAGQPGDHALQLRTPFGGGKTHSLLALYHLATARDRIAAVEDLDGISDPGPIRLAVLSGEYLDPQRGRDVDGRRITTLWGELAYQLGGWEAYERLLVDDEEGTPPGGERLAPLLSGAPALVLLDEVLVYIAKGKAIRREDSTAGQQALIFIQNLGEALNQQRQGIMVYSLQASVGEAVHEEGLLTALEHVAARVDARREPVTGDEVLRVVQQRLFADLGDPAVGKEVAGAYGELLRDELRTTAETDDDRREADGRAAALARRIEESYPFHPELIDLMYQRWGSLPSYQRTRGALQFLATVAHALWAKRGDLEPQALIGPGDVDLSDEAVRASFFEQVGQATQYAAVVEADFLSANAGSKVVDERVGRASPALRQLRVGSRVSTAIALLSFGARDGEDRGALEREVVQATLVPSLDGNVLRDALAALRKETLLYLHYTGRRYRFETRANLNMLVTTEEGKLTSDEVLGVLRRNLEEAIGAGGPDIAIWPDGPAKVPDGQPAFVVAYLPLDADIEPESLSAYVAGEGGGRTNKNAIALVTPSRMLTDAARAAGRTTLAHESLLARSRQHNFDAEQKAELKERAQEANRTLSTSVGQLYERVHLPVGPEGPGGVAFETIDLGTVLAAGRSVHERVRDALGHHVFDTLRSKKVISISRLAERKAVRCEDLAPGFFRYYDFTKLWSLDPLRAAIAEGVASGDFAYAVGVEGDPPEVRVGDPNLIQLGSAIRPEEIDLGSGAALLTPELARSLVPKPGGEQEAEAGIGSAGDGDNPPPGGSDSSGQPKSGSGADIDHQSVTLEISATEDDLHTLQLALNGLREIVRPGQMRIKLKVTASRPDAAIEQVAFQNRVRQHLEEDEDVTFEERWE